MAKPISYFAYSKSGLTVKFQNASLNSPTTFQWDFGDGVTSTDKNPIHTYSELGFFTVKLVVTNTDGQDTLIQSIGASDIDDMMSSSLIELLFGFIPNPLLPEMTLADKIAIIRKWQLYLQPLVEIPFKVSVEDTYNEYRWPGLVNHLIAQLAAYDIIIQVANQFLLGSSQIDIGNGELPTEPGKPQLKSIETGPAKTEWYENKNNVNDSESAVNISKALSNATKEGGILDILKQNICQLSQRVRIFLPMCGELPYDPLAPLVVSKCNDCGHNANPFGVTERMR